ncbi:MAG: sulfite exporter TauE/SafE family protein [Clostridia bacterium]|nr:sulfite exporter TauE/SafE family protein [Clostridia bacterium]MBR3594036.1 sulfite exporter TauE/SafE family protein [Clostridia bacterium]
MNIENILAGLLAGTAAAMGLGGGTVLLIYLSLFTAIPQLTAQGINLLTFVPTAAVAVAVYAYRKQIKWKLWLFMAPLGVLGSILGSLILPYIPVFLLRKILGGILIFMGLSRLFARDTCKE